MKKKVLENQTTAVSNWRWWFLKCCEPRKTSRTLIVAYVGNHVVGSVIPVSLSVVVVRRAEKVAQAVVSTILETLLEKYGIFFLHLLTI